MKCYSGVEHAPSLYYIIIILPPKGRLWYILMVAAYTRNIIQYDPVDMILYYTRAYGSLPPYAGQPWEQRYRTCQRRQPAYSSRTVRRVAVLVCRGEHRNPHLRAARPHARQPSNPKRAHDTTVHATKHQQQQRARVGPFVSRRARCVVTRHRRSSLLTSVRSRAPCVRSFGPLLLQSVPSG